MRTLFAQPGLLWALAAVPMLAALAWRHARWRRRALFELGASRRGDSTIHRWARPLQGVCLALGLALVGVGAAGPQWGLDEKTAIAPGRDLVVVLDRSRSMLAETPRRITRARAALLTLADDLKTRGGHRVALVTFAGRARLVCPLTHDYDHFREMVAEMDPESLDPELAPTSGQASGTRIGRGILEGLAALENSHEVGDLLLLSDGDDPAQDGEWRTGISAARAAGVAILVVGIGDPNDPSLVPLDRPGEEPQRMMHEGAEVRSRLEESPLRRLAEDTDGFYESARAQVPPLGPRYRQWIADRPLREDNAEGLPILQQRPNWMLLPALLLLTLWLYLRERRREPRRPHVAPAATGSVPPVRRAFAAVSVVLVAVAAGPSTADLLRGAYTAYARGDLERAVALFEQAEPVTTDPGQLAYVLAVLKHRLAGQRSDPRLLGEAEQLYRSCLAPNNPRRPAAYLGLGNCLTTRSDGRDVDLLEAAREAFLQCLADPGADDALRADARHNLQRVRLFLAQYNPVERPADPPTGNEPNPQPPPPIGSTDPNPDPNQKGNGKDRPDSPPMPLKKPPEGDAQTTTEIAPGLGNLPPVPETDDLPPLAPADATRHLEQAAARIRAERQRALRIRAARPPAPGVRDW